MGQLNEGLFSSKRTDWETPQDLFDALNDMFVFDLDPCATDLNAKTLDYFTEKEDGLSQEWFGSVFMNPPYGRVIGDWIRKAWSESLNPRVSVVVGLIPARTDTKYWHDYVMRANYIMFVKGRVHFSGGESAPFPSAIVIWMGSETDDGYPHVSTWDLKNQREVVRR